MGVGILAIYRRGGAVLYSTLLLFGTFYFYPHPSLAKEVEAQLTISGLRSEKGYVAVNVFPEDQKRGFPDKNSLATKSYYLEVHDSDSLRIDLKGLKEGRYAIAVMHDEDGDKKLKITIFGIPQEGFGFSKNPRIYFGPPSFEKAAVEISDESKLTIEMKYFL